MVTDVQNAISVSTQTASNMSQTPQPQPSHTQQPTNITLSTGAKKKKKKKTTSPLSTHPVAVSQTPSQSASRSPHPITMSEQSPSSSASSPSPPPLDPAITEQWQQRVQSLRTALNKSQKENQLMASDLAAALARASDAEHAEHAVNKGLLTARSVLSQRDRTIAELKSTSSNLRADLTHLQDEKKKTDKRLILLKTVSANLQETREARDSVEKKLDDANTEIASLKKHKTHAAKEIEALKQHVETMEMVKQQLARREIEIDELSRAKHHVEEKARRGEVLAFAVGFVSMFAVSIATRVLGRSRSSNDTE